MEATYRVGDSTTQEKASLTSDYTVEEVRAGNNTLKFSQATVSREVSEGKKGMNVGAPVTATDSHGAVNYTLVTGVTIDDDGKFKIDQKTGQITTDMDLDYDTVDADNCRDADFCTVTVRATDASGDATDDTTPTIDATVIIKVTDVNEKPEFTSDTTAMSPKTIMRDEDMTALADSTDEANVTYMATDPEALNVNLTLMGSDGDKFSLSSAGVLSFTAKPDYEMPTDANKDNVYEVTVRASDGTLHEDRVVKVTVMNVDEAPEIIQGGLGISGRTSVSLVEGSTTIVGARYTASGPEASSARWTLAGDDRGDFMVQPGRGMSTTLRFRNAPDYDSPVDDNRDNVYMVTVKATDSDDNMAMREVTVTVTEMDDEPTVPTPGDGSLMDRYDDDDNGKIDLSEARTAVGHYFAQPPTLTEAEVRQVVGLYFEGLQSN